MRKKQNITRNFEYLLLFKVLMMFCKIIGMVVDKKQTTDLCEVLPCVVFSH
jgi:hypothetical protein